VLVNSTRCEYIADCIGIRPPSYQEDDPPPYSLTNDEGTEHGVANDDHCDVVNDVIGGPIADRSRDEDKRPLQPHLNSDVLQSVTNHRGRTTTLEPDQHQLSNDVDRRRRTSRRLPEELFRGRSRRDELRRLSTPEVDDEEDDNGMGEIRPAYCNVIVIDDGAYCKTTDSCSSRGYADDEMEESIVGDDRIWESDFTTTMGAAAIKSTRRSSDNRLARDDYCRHDTASAGNDGSFIDQRKSCLERRRLTADDDDDEDDDDPMSSVCRGSALVYRQMEVASFQPSASRVPCSHTCPSLQSKTTDFVISASRDGRRSTGDERSTFRRSSDLRMAPKSSFGAAPGAVATAGRDDDVRLDRRQPISSACRRPTAERSFLYCATTMPDAVSGDDDDDTAVDVESLGGAAARLSSPTTAGSSRLRLDNVKPSTDMAIIEISTYLIGSGGGCGQLATSNNTVDRCNDLME